MTTSYKTLWQEEKQANEKLTRQLERERREHRRELDKLIAYIAANRNNLAQTRPIVDLAGIARHMNVARFTPQQWAQRKALPPVDFPEIREPLWYASTVRDQFAVPTGRIWYDVPPVDAAEWPDLSPTA